MRRIRTTKERAKRIDMMYFARPHWLRSWRFWLSLAVPVIALGWFLISHAHNGGRAFSSGPLSRSHAVFTQQCMLCHVRQAGGFFENVTDKACLNCHDAPAHQANQKFTPTCASCHVEHKGAMRLAATANTSCTQCHESLETRSGSSKYDHSITGFDGKHPEFSALRDPESDPGGVRLNHYLHMRSLLTPDHRRVQLTCDDCHRPAEVNQSGSNEFSRNAPWLYGDPKLKATAAAVTTGEPPAAGSPHAETPHTKGSALMAQPTFANTCAGCHLLDFDGPRFAAEQAPHDKPAVIHSYFTKRYAEYIATHPVSVREVVIPDRRLPERMRVPRVARTANEWVQFRVEETEALLWLKTCKECHTAIASDSNPLPDVVKSNMTPRWLPHSTFDHTAHRMMKCESCHTRTEDSHETKDVLIPSIKTCRDCHRESGPAKDFAEGRCFECHSYHNWRNEQHIKGMYGLEQLLGP